MIINQPGKPEGISIVEQAEYQHIKNLLETFWGRGSSLANYTQQHVTYTDSRIMLEHELMKSKPDIELVRACLTGKRISIMAIDEHTQELIAHCSLLVSADTVEASGAVIKDTHRGRGIIRLMNTYRKELLRMFAALGYTLTSFLVIGSPSIDYGRSILNFPEINMLTIFTNIGPYILQINPEDLSKQDPRLIALSRRSALGLVASTSQVLGVRRDKPPFVDKQVISSLPPITVNVLESVPYTFASHRSKSSNSNQYYATTANLNVHILVTQLGNVHQFIQKLILTHSLGKSVLVKIPMHMNAIGILEQLRNMIEGKSNNYRLVPTGLTLVDDYWTGCYTFLDRSEQREYISMLQRMSMIYSGSLKSIVDISLSQ